MGKITRDFLMCDKLGCTAQVEMPGGCGPSDEYTELPEGWSRLEEPRKPLPVGVSGLEWGGNVVRYRCPAHPFLSGS